MPLQVGGSKTTFSHPCGIQTCLDILQKSLHQKQVSDTLEQNQESPRNQKRDCVNSPKGKGKKIQSEVKTAIKYPCGSNLM